MNVSAEVLRMDIFLDEVGQQKNKIMALPLHTNFAIILERFYKRKTKGGY